MASGHNRRAVKWFVALALLAGLSAAGWWFANQKNGLGQSINTIEVTRGDIQQLVSATGVLEPSNYVDVGGITKPRPIRCAPAKALWENT